MDLINREEALACFWNYANDDGTGYDETDTPAYERLQALPIVADVEDCISRQAVIKEFNCCELTPDGGIDVNYAIDFINQLPSAQPQSTMGQVTDAVQSTNDCISRQAAIDAIAKKMPSWTTPDGSGEFDHDIQVADEAFVDCMQIINELPSARSEIIRCRDCKHHDGVRCFRWNSTIITGFDDFCSNAERRQK